MVLHEKDYVFYLIPALWGIADSAWQTQVNSIYGVLFKDNQTPAFSNFRLWESLGFAISYAYSSYLCTSTKLYLLLVYLTFGMLGYYLVELIEAKVLKVTSPIVVNYNKLQVFLVIFITIYLTGIFLF